MGNSRICIVTPRSTNDSPCLEKYKAIIDEPYDIIYWIKGDDKRDCGAANVFPYQGEVPVEGGKWVKIKHYFALRNFARKVITKNHYEKLVVYPTHMAWLLRGLLRKKYKGKYLLDIRDYAGENNPVIGRLTAEAVKNAGLCTITSPAYESFLPKGYNYIISHNLQPISEELIRSYRLREHDLSKPIVLSFIGTVRFLSQQKKILSVFGNDNRFFIKYVGFGSDALKEFCQSGQYNNVELIGQFDRDELGKFYMDTDMAINVYGNDSPALMYALSNKLYSAAMMGMPILVSTATYMEEIACKYGFGLAIDLDDKKCADKVYDYFNSLDYIALHKNCDQFIKDAYREEAIFNKKVKAFLDKNTMCIR